jgi:uncharacterized membrane protein YqjE
MLVLPTQQELEFLRRQQRRNRLVKGIAVGLILALSSFCLWVVLDCHREDELRAIRGQVYGDRAAVERALNRR